jgi:hypothetical protein
LGGDHEATSRALEKAGQRWLKALGATEEETVEAAVVLADMHHDADAEGCADADWPARLAHQIQEQRDWNETEESFDERLGD